MCLVPISGFSDMPTIIPTPRARKIGSVMLVALVFHVILAALEFSALSIIDGMFDLIGAVVGYCAIRDSNRYNVYQVLCYCIYTGMDFFWGSVRIVLIATKATRIPGHKKWQYELYLVTVIGGTIFYLLACIISNMLYQELRKILQEINEPQAWTPDADGINDVNGSRYDGNGGVAPVHGPMGPGGYQQISQSESHFQGTAFKLGAEKNPSCGENAVIVNKPDDLRDAGSSLGERNVTVQ